MATGLIVKYFVTESGQSEREIERPEWLDRLAAAGLQSHVGAFEHMGTTGRIEIVTPQDQERGRLVVHLPPMDWTWSEDQQRYVPAEETGDGV